MICNFCLTLLVHIDFSIAFLGVIGIDEAVMWLLRLTNDIMGKIFGFFSQTVSIFYPNVVSLMDAQRAKDLS